MSVSRRAFPPESAEPPAAPGPDQMPMDLLLKLFGMDDGFFGEFSILGPHLRKATANWAQEIPRQIVVDEATQDAMTIRDLNRLTAHVEDFVGEMALGQFGNTFESALDGIALIMCKHGINSGWATAALTLCFDKAQQQIYAETRSGNGRVFPAALRCISKIMALSMHILNRRDCELGPGVPQRGAAGGGS